MRGAAAFLVTALLLGASTLGAADDGSHGEGEEHEHHIHRPRHHRVHPFFTSQYYQVHDPDAPPKLDRILNVSTDSDIRELIAKVAYRHEIIMFAFNSRGLWMDWALAMADTLRRIGYQHFFALSEEYCCVKLHRRDPTIPCVFANLPGQRWRKPKAAGDNFVDTNPEDIWIMRYRVGSEIASRDTNILVLDLDCIFRRDVYVDLKSPPLHNVTLIHQEEGFANGGLFYIQNARRNGPALWTHDEVWRRTETIADMRQGDPSNFDANCMDQALLNDALNSAALPDGSAYDWPSVYNEERNGKHPFWHDEKRRGEKSKRGPGQPIYGAGDLYKHEIADPELFAEPIKGCNAQGHSCRTPEFRRYIAPYLLKERSSLRTPFVLRIPKDAPERALPGGHEEELFMAAPFWTFGHREDALRDFDISALTHLVGTDAGWAGGPNDGWRNGLHSGRRAMMAAAGGWTLAPSERIRRRNFLDMGAAMLENATRVPVRYATLSPHLVRAARGNTIGDEPGKGAAAAAAGSGEAAGAAAAGSTHHLHGAGKSPVGTKNATTHLILRFAAAALALNRTPALFGFPCEDALWLKRDEASRLGIYDERVIKKGDLCYPGVGGMLCSDEEVVYDFELEYSGPPPRTVAAFEEAFHFDPEEPVVHLRHLPAKIDSAAIPEEFRKACPNYFEAGEDEAQWEERDDAWDSDGGRRRSSGVWGEGQRDGESKEAFAARQDRERRLEAILVRLEG